MVEYLLTVLGSTAATLLLLGALGWLLRTWIETRFKAAIDLEYAKKIETFKADLNRQHETTMEQVRDLNSRLKSIHESVSGTFGQIHAVAQERRLVAIETVWAAVVAARNETPSGLILADAFKPKEYDYWFFKVPDIKPFLDAIDLKILPKLSIAKSDSVEKHRPFMSEYIYSLYEAYRLLTTRVIASTALGIMKGKVTPWFEDEVNLAVVRNVLGDEMREFEASETKFLHIRRAIETRILAKAARIISGEASSAHMLERSNQILESLSNLRAEMAKEKVPTN